MFAIMHYRYNALSPAIMHYNALIARYNALSHALYAIMRASVTQTFALVYMFCS